MPVILGPDGPSLGGFVCPATIVAAELWKIGQLQGRATRCASAPSRCEEARALLAAAGSACARSRAARRAPIAGTAIARRRRAAADRACWSGCQATGERPSRDRAARTATPTCWSSTARWCSIWRCASRARADAPGWKRGGLPGIVDLTPGIRSLQIHYDDALLPRERLLGAARRRAEAELPRRRRHRGALAHRPPAAVLGRSRDPAGHRASTPSRCAPTRPGARATSSSFVASTASIASTRCTTSCSRPVTWCWAWATSIWAPRWRRRSIRATAWSPPSTTRPAPGRRRTRSASAAPICASTAWKGPGGYQFVGRTCQMWNRFHETRRLPGRARWLLRFFDQIRFYPVGAGRAARAARGLSARQGEPAHRRDHLPHRPTTAPSCATTPASIEDIQAATAGGVRSGARAVGAAAPVARRARDGARRGGRRCDGDAAAPAPPPCAPTCQERLAGAGRSRAQQGRRRRQDDRARDHEDGDRGGGAHRRHRHGGLLPAGGAGSAGPAPGGAVSGARGQSSRRRDRGQ